MCHQQRFWRHKKLDNKGSSIPDDGAEPAAHSPEVGQAEEATESKVAKQKRTKRDVVSIKATLSTLCARAPQKLSKWFLQQE